MENKKLGKLLKKKSVSYLKKKLWKLFSEYIRRRDEKYGCITCGKKYPWKKLHAGHFITCSSEVIRYDEKNVNGQCYVCNIHRKGDYPTYRENLIKKHNEQSVLLLESVRRTLHKWYASDLEVMIVHYQQELKEME